MKRVQSIAIFCASSAGHHPRYCELAAEVGDKLAKANIRVVYGGSRNGMMGALADAALAAGGEVIGVIPHRLGTREIAHTGLTQLEHVADMHERKHRMHQLSDAVLALPGGFGTLDELVEMITWRQMGIHHKSIALLNAFNYYDHLLGFIAHAVREGLIREPDFPAFSVAENLEMVFRIFDIESD